MNVSSNRLILGCMRSVASYRHALNKEVEGIHAIQRRWATKRAGGSTKNGRDSISKRLGLKKFGG